MYLCFVSCAVVVKQVQEKVWAQLSLIYRMHMHGASLHQVVGIKARVWRKIWDGNEGEHAALTNLVLSSCNYV